MGNVFPMSACVVAERLAMFASCLSEPPCSERPARCNLSGAGRDRREANRGVDNNIDQVEPQLKGFPHAEFVSQSLKRLPRRPLSHTHGVRRLITKLVVHDVRIQHEESVDKTPTIDIPVERAPFEQWFQSRSEAFRRDQWNARTKQCSTAQRPT